MILLVVESPNKVKAIQKYLDATSGGPWKVIASVGHWRGLPPMSGQSFSDVVSNDGQWRENFVVHNKDVERRLRAAIKQANKVYLATDPDREGEAIAWHIVDHFRLRDAKRVTFHEITPTAVAAAVRNPTLLDTNLVEAQRARAILDYQVGMEVSRRLWRFGARSAGRVQSCALRILVDRERAITSFKPTAFWTVSARYKEGFTASVATFETPSEAELDNNPDADRSPQLRPRRFTSEAEAMALVEAGSQVSHIVESYDAKTSFRKPPPPFTTALLLAAGSDLGLKPDQVSAVAQRLFEAGLITYIRTDSVAMADDAIAEIRDHLKQHHPHLLPQTPIRHTTNAAGAQGAHEAIRPTHIDNPDAVALTGTDKQLYDIIRQRAVVSQALPACYDNATITIAPKGCDWRLLAHGSVLRHPGYLELLPKQPAASDDSASSLPKLEPGHLLNLIELTAKAGSTKPPPRFIVKSLIRYLERRGIGRPSTYSTLISTLFDRGYACEQKKKLVPDDIGVIANDLVKLGFDKLSQEGFTAITERSLDKIAKAELSRTAFLTAFSNGFAKMLEAAVPVFNEWAKDHPERDREAEMPHDTPCPKCSSAMVKRVGKHGPYARCVNGDCSFVQNLTPLKELKQPCPKCGGVVVEQPYRKDGKRKTFFRCKASDCPWRDSKPPPARARAGKGRRRSAASASHMRASRAG